MHRLQKVMAPLMGKITQSLGFGAFGGMDMGMGHGQGPTME